MIFYKERKQLLNFIISPIIWKDKILYLTGHNEKNISMPDFIIAGLPKCGTVWLVDTLRQHPMMNYVRNPFFDNKGEIRFFSTNFNFPIRKYFDAFKNKKEGCLYFEKSPDYSIMSRARIKLIKKLNPKIKIILMFREPIDRTYSNAKMDLIRSRGLHLNKDNEFLFFKHYKNNSQVYDYSFIIKKWQSVFQKDALLYLSLEQIKEDPKLVTQKTLEFLGVQDNFEFSFSKAKNISKAKPIPEDHKAYIEKLNQRTINFWENNQELFLVSNKNQSK